MSEKPKSSKRLQKEKEESEKIEKEKKSFLECVLKSAEPEFKKFVNGYKVYSIHCPQKSYFSLDDNMVTNIINNIADLYKCKFNSLSISQPPLSYKVYTLVFEK